MIVWLLLVLLGAVTYLILQRRVAYLTRTPIWILWLVLMTPAIIWLGWLVVYGENAPIPPILAIAPFAVCPIIYWFLVQWGRRPLPRGEVVETQEEEEESESPSESELPETEPRPLTPEEENQLRDCFSWTVYPLHGIDYRPQAVICRGQLRAAPDVAYHKIETKIHECFGDRFLVVLQEDFKGQPFFVLVPNPQRQRQRDDLSQPAIALALAAITLFTTTVMGTQIAGLAIDNVFVNPVLLIDGLPYAIALMAILGIHESAHYLCARYYQIEVTLPYFIPFPAFLGTFGAFIQMRSPMPNRKVLFDISLAGPVAGFVLTVPLLLWGLHNSTVVDLPEEGGLLTIEALNPRFSFLLTILSKIALGSQLTAQGAIALHPVAVAAYIGLIATAFNLMPVGQLDGGHLVHAMFGQRTAVMVGQFARFSLLALSFLYRDWFFLALFLFIMPILDNPALNDLSELDDRRDFCGLVAIAVLLSIVLPAPSFVTQWLNL
jgi:membrane-associated protease RseP (regulator of RpoE activity)